MPTDAGDGYRVVIDEDSLDLRELTDDDLNEALHTFAELLERLADGQQVALMDPAWDVTCWDEVTLLDLHYARNGRVSRDTRLRIARLLDKCRKIEPQDDDLSEPVCVNGVTRELSWGMSHALARVTSGRAMSCLVLARPAAAPWPTGWITVERGAERLDLHVLSDLPGVTGFWRELFTRESVPEESFVALAETAFPGLIFAESLSFRRFRGSYDEVMPWLVKLLGVLNDHFARAVDAHHGIQNHVIRELGAHGVEISPESQLTRKNASAWAERLVSHQNREHRCDWHGKRLWDRDRVHFSAPLPEYGGRVLIGIFADHLPT